jgi:hypothetical protein
VAGEVPRSRTEPQERAVSRAPAPDARRAALIGIPASIAVGVTVIALGDHFIHTGNRAGIAAVLGGLVLLMLVSDLTVPRGSRLRGALGTLTAVTVTAAAFGGLYWITGRHWGEPATYAAGVAWWAVIGAVMLAVSRVRRRLYWRKYGYSPEARRADADAYRIIPRRGAHR